MNIFDIKIFFVIFGLFLLIDILVISLVNNKMYQKQFFRINKTKINIGFHTWLSALFAYLLLTLGLFYFIVKPQIQNIKIQNNYPHYFNIFIKGFIFGFIIYGIYNGTNMATINEWGIKEFIIDTLWGSLLSGVLSIGSIYLLI